MKTISKASIVCLLLAIGAGIYITRQRAKLEGVTVQSEYGQIKGVRSISRGGRLFHEFLGIPYGEPPVGELRFEAPLPYKRHWRDSDMPYDASYYRSPCAQLSLVTALKVGSEDCLYLNVFTPNLNSDSKHPLPVLVYFYGGLFMEGQSNMYGAKYLMDEDVVLVTLNYRVGALGFLNTGDGVVLGNMGLKDQNLALQWVKANIRTFDGDPNRVTIFGQSAGSAAVHYHMLSEQSAGLFHRAISQSGVALNPWAFTPNPAEQARRFAKMLNCSTENGAVLVTCLKGKDVNEITETHREVLDVTRDPITVFVPSVEIEGPTAFLTKNPFDIKHDTNYPSQVPWLSGLVQDEGLIATTLLFRNHTLWHMNEKNWSRMAPRALYYTLEAPDTIVTVTQKIRSLYLPDADDSSPRDEIMLRNLTALFTDRHFHKGIHDAALDYATDTKAPVYLYYYAYSSQFSLADIILAVQGRWFGLLPPIIEIAGTFIWILLQRALFGTEPKRYGVCHADEVHMLFNIGLHDAIGVGHVDYEMSRRIVKTWVQFASGAEMEFENVAWPQISAKNANYMQIGDVGINKRGGQLVQSPNVRRLEFWNSLGLSNG